MTFNHLKFFKIINSIDSIHIIIDTFNLINMVRSIGMQNLILTKEHKGDIDQVGHNHKYT